MTPVLEVEDLTVSYRRPGRPAVEAVRGMTFDLSAGATLGLAGESGSGKSTAALALLRLLPATARVGGSVRLDGEELTSATWGRLRAVRWAQASMVFQGAMSALNPVRTIGEQIREPIVLHRTESGRSAVNRRVAELLDAVGIAGSRATAYPHELSGGQRQRVMIAMALACRPRLIVADEPTTALDVIVQAQVLDLLTTLVREQDIGLLVISHDLVVLADTCDRLAVAHRGRIVELGPSRQVVTTPAHEYTRTLVEASAHIGDPTGRPERRGTRGTPGSGRTLRARNLEVTFPGRRGRPPARAVDGVDLELAPGEILALIGESGCGKSTLARSLVGLVPPTAGAVEVDGNPLGRSAADLRRHRRSVQLVLQDPGGALNPRHDVRTAVAEGPRLHGVREGLPERVLDALSRAGLRPPEEFLDRFPHELSGGQQQRVVIAGALALEPAVLVADEPVASLDASVGREILDLVLRLRAELSLSALLVSHDLGLAWHTADRVAVMYLGRIVEQGPVEDVLQAPRHPYTRALLAAAPGAPDTTDDGIVPGEPPDPTAIPSGCRFHPRCPLRNRLAAAGTDVTRCATTDPGVLTADAVGAACHFSGGADLTR